MYMFSMRVDEKATALDDNATGTNKLRPVPFLLGTIILYGTSYQLDDEPLSNVWSGGQKFPSKVTSVVSLLPGIGTAYLPVMCWSNDQSPTAMLSVFNKGSTMLFWVMT